MIVGMRALTWSCSFFEDDEDAKESRFEQWLDKVFGEKLESILMTVVMIFSFIMAIGIFMLLPMFISNICKKVIPSHTVMAILEGFIRIAIFIIYIKWYPVWKTLNGPLCTMVPNTNASTALNMVWN